MRGGGRCGRLPRTPHPIPPYGPELNHSSRILVAANIHDPSLLYSWMLKGSPKTIFFQSYKETNCTPLALNLSLKLASYCLSGGGWGTWSGYGPCSKSCHHGYQTRKRKCNSPSTCQGPFEERRKCNVHVRCPGKKCSG